MTVVTANGGLDVVWRACALRFLRALLAITAFLFVAAGARAQISPGPLSKAHQSLNGSTQCNSCHQFGTSTPTFKCLDCHKEIAERLTAHKGFHAQLGMKNPNGRDCVRCHLEHNGEDFSPRSLGAVAQTVRSQTGWLSAGGKARRGCLREMPYSSAHGPGGPGTDTRKQT